MPYSRDFRNACSVKSKGNNLPSASLALAVPLQRSSHVQVLVTLDDRGYVLPSRPGMGRSRRPLRRILASSARRGRWQSSSARDAASAGQQRHLSSTGARSREQARAESAPPVSPTRVRLDGKSGCIVIPPTRNEDLDMAGSSLTLAIWIKPSQSYDDEELLMEHGVWQQSKGMYQLSTADSRTLRFNFPAMNSNEGRLDAAVNLADGNWHFAVATFDTSTHLAKIYDNGVLLKSKTVRESIAGDGTHTDLHRLSRQRHGPLSRRGRPTLDLQAGDLRGAGRQASRPSWRGYRQPGPRGPGRRLPPQ